MYRKKIEGIPTNMGPAQEPYNKPFDCHNFCTVAGQDYVIKVITLYRSLARNTSNFCLWICCLDAFTYRTLASLNLKNTIIFMVGELEDESLRKVKKERRVDEYCWTLKAPLIEYLLKSRNLPSIVYCDSDLYFFSDPKPIFNEWGESSVYLCPQRDLKWVEEKYGHYQAGLIGFNNDKSALECLRWWKEKCLDWCYAVPEEGKFGDQMYLDYLPTLCPDIKISEHLGIDAAPWNCIYNNNYNIEKMNNQLFIETDPLIAFHFACLDIFKEDEFDLWTLDRLDIKGLRLKEIYIPYLEEIQVTLDLLKEISPHLIHYRDQDFFKAKTPYKLSTFKRKMNQWDDFYCFCTIVSEEYLVKGITLYHSLKQQCDNFHLWICCMDETSFNKLSKIDLSHATIISIKEIETNELKYVKNSRTLQEYCWTLKPQLCLYLLETFKEIDRLVYCDADLYFFSNPKPIFDEWGTYSMFMCSQRADPELGTRYGYYQAGLLGFRQEENSRNILNWWSNKCLDWCFDENDELWNRWGDQKYLEHIPHLFDDVKIIRNIGVNAAPWNLVMNNLYSVHQKNNTTMLDNSALIIFHFGSLKIINEEEFELWKYENLNFTSMIIINIYKPYLQALQHTMVSYQLKEKRQKNSYLPKNRVRLPINVS